MTNQIILVPPYFENFGKRLIKSPKVYFVDSGLACHLLGIGNEQALARSPFLGPLFEGFIASEILKQQLAAGRSREIYYFRDQQGLEVDFVIPVGHRGLLIMEVKAARTVTPVAAGAVARLVRAASGYDARGLVVYRPSTERAKLTAILPDVRAVGLEDLLSAIEVG